MAKKPSKQQQREREAAARREQQARDRKNQTIIGIVVVAVLVVVLAVVGFFIWKANQPVQKESVTDAKASVSKVADKPAAAGSEFGFMLSKNGINEPIDDVPTVQVYMDFMCPACGSTDRELAPTWKQMLNAGQINLDIHPGAYLDSSSSDEYSTRTASAVSYVAQNEPEHLLAFITALFEEDFQPQEASNYRSVSDDAIVKQAEKAGVSAKVAQASVGGTYKDWIKAVSTYTPLRKAVQHPSGDYKGQMTTPTILINGHFWDVSDAYSSTGSLKTSFISAMGLKAAQVGDSSAKPTIGGTKTPAFPTAQ
ncbi:MAG: thioredoxin domain-containing protein [Bifidobacteriaceae bacterium]|jgi:protein-disulfide isomerase|nr:thioredoxin domain-containing protein [Bifidobacteriaceae bacterium]